jgi:purine-binding chemotaxis protein CheW
MEQQINPSEISTRPEEQHSGSEQLLQLVSFKIGNEEFGLDILRGQEIIRLQDLTRVPNSPYFVDGVINLRGKVIPIIALRKRFGLEEQAYDKQTRIVVLEFQNMVLGFIVDSVSEVLRIPPSTLAHHLGSANSSANLCRAWASSRTGF